MAVRCLECHKSKWYSEFLETRPVPFGQVEHVWFDVCHPCRQAQAEAAAHDLAQFFETSRREVTA